MVEQKTNNKKPKNHQTSSKNNKNPESQPSPKKPELTIFKYYAKTSTIFKSSSDLCFYTESLRSLINDFHPSGILLDPKLKSPLKEKFVPNLVNKITSLLDKGKIVGIQTFDGEAESYRNLYSGQSGSVNNANNNSKNQNSNNCHLDSVKTLLIALKQRMPKQLKVYMQEFELTKTEIWRPKNDITANIRNKLLPMEVKRTSPQAYVVLSKSELEILVPWAKAIEVPKKVRKNKSKNKDKDDDKVKNPENVVENQQS